MTDATKRLAAALVVAALGALAPAVAPRLTAAAAGPAATSGARLLYRADWRRGFGPWMVYQGFGIAHGMMTFDGHGDDGAFAPFKLTGLANFAVEATIQVGTPTAPRNASYDIFVRRSSRHQQTGLFAGYDATSGEQQATNVADLSWAAGQGSYWNYVPGTALPLPAGFHTYRLEVRGDAYRFLVDGRVMVPWTVAQIPNPADEVGLSFTYVPATVKAFKVFALAPAPVATILNTGTLPSPIVPVWEVPLQIDYVTFRDNTRYALDNALPRATVQSTGRLYGYTQDVTSVMAYATLSVNLHRDAAGARAALDLFARRLQRESGRLQGFHRVSVSGLGDASAVFSYADSSLGSTPDVATVLFQRGRHYVAITVDAAPPRAAPIAIAYARLVSRFVR